MSNTKPTLYKFLSLRDAIYQADSADELREKWQDWTDMSVPEDLEVIQFELMHLYESKLEQLENIKKYMIQIPQWLAREKDIPKMIIGEIIRETQKAYFVKGSGDYAKSDNCMICGKKLTNPVSLKYGLGIQCGGHWGIDPEGQSHEEILNGLKRITTFEVWIPKSQIQHMEEVD